MLTYSFENIDCPLYEHIYKSIRKDITEGRLKPGEKLPSKRSFAQNNGISTITIQNAYDQLISEGYVNSIPKKGYYVADIRDISPAVKVEEPVSFNDDEESGDELISLSSNRSSPESFPFSVWTKLMRETMSLRKEELLAPSPTGGTAALREAIARHLMSFRGMRVSPKQVVIGAGTEYLYGLLIQLLGRDRIYCIENPGYKKLLSIYKSQGAVCRFVDMDSLGITADGLRNAKAEIAHISPTHHFPTGITMPASRRYELLSWANEESGRYIIEDDYDSEFRLNGRPVQPLQSIDTGERVIYMNTFSKSLSSTIRISYMVLPPHLVARLYRELAFYSCTVSNFEQYTLAEFIRRGYFEKHINRMRLSYSRKRAEVLKCLKESSLGGRCRVIENDSGLHFLLQLDTELEDGIFISEMKKQGMEIKALSDYYHGGEDIPQHLFILNYSSVRTEELGRSFEIINKILTDNNE